MRLNCMCVRAASLRAAGSGADIFGNRPSKSSAETVVCTNCGMPLAANRFAPHLERCLLGRGRQRRTVAQAAAQGAS